MQLKINPLYTSLMTPLSDEEYSGLKESIRAHGQFNPIVVNLDDTVLDGHNRYKVCQELGIKPKVKKVSFNPKDEIDYVLSVNINRRHLHILSMVVLADRKYGDGSGAGPWKKSETDVAFEFGCSKGNFHRARQIIKVRGVDAALALPRKKKFSLSKEYELVMKEKKAKARRSDFQHALPTRSNLFLVKSGFILEDGTDPVLDASVDAIVVDPPYPRRFIHLFKDLALYASKKLKSGGSLLIMSGQEFLPEVFRLVEAGSHGVETDSSVGGYKPVLNYYWTLAYLIPNERALIHGKDIQNGWKPVLWYVKLDRKDFYEGAFSSCPHCRTSEFLTKSEVPYCTECGWTPKTPTLLDTVVSKTMEKDGSALTSISSESHKKWQQSVSGFEALIERCTRPGDVVLDPMMGWGTTGVAAIRLKRRFVGIDNDAEAYKIASERIKAEENNDVS